MVIVVDNAAADLYHSAAEVLYKLQLVSYHKHSGASLVYLVKDPDDLLGGTGVKVSCRLVGNNELGLFTSALAIATRCCSPPESSLGKHLAFFWRPIRPIT